MAKKENNGLIFNDNIFNHIRSLQDLDDFIEAVKIVYNSREGVCTVSVVSLQLLWCVAAYVCFTARTDEHNIQAMAHILNKACNPTKERSQKNTFSIMVDNSSDEHLKENYDYFMLRVFGTYSNYYKTILKESREILDFIVSENEALISSFKNISKTELNENREKLFGKLSNKTGQDKQIELYDRRKVAVHEAGHAIANILLKNPFAGVSIVSTSEGLGCVQPIGWSEVSSEKKVISLYAGIAAEDVFFSPVFLDVWGASNDIQRATKIVKDDVLNETRVQASAQEYIFVDTDVLGLNNDSPFIVYETIKRCVQLRQKAVELITTNKHLVQSLAEELLIKESLAYEEVCALFEITQKLQGFVALDKE